jgi:hypothetical protein
MRRRPRACSASRTRSRSASTCTRSRGTAHADSIFLLASDLPSSVDPRGLGTFALTGLALAVIGMLILRGGAFPRPLGYLAFVSAALLVFVYVGRLVILNPKSLGPLAGAVLAGYVVEPDVVRLGRALAAPPARVCDNARPYLMISTCGGSRSVCSTTQ